MHISLSYNVYTASTNIATKFSRLYVIIRFCLLLPATSKPCPAAGTFEIAAKPLASAKFKPADGDE